MRDFNPQITHEYYILWYHSTGRNQDHLGMLGGMDIIVNSMQTVVETLLQEPSPDCTDAAMQLSSLLVSCVTDNSKLWN